MITFQEELNNIYGLKKLDGFQIEKVIYESDKTTILLLKLDDKLLIAKKYDSNDFLKVVKEYLFEFNMKNYFTIEPISIFEYDNGYCIVMDYYLPMSDFFTFFPKKMNDEILQDININKLIFFSILLVSVYSLHVQKVPIIHHDLKPKNILLIPYRIIDGKLQRIEISPKVKYKHEPGTFYIPQLIDFDLTKETDEKTNMMGTPGYRTADFYTEFSDIFSLAIIFEEIILGFTKFNEFNKSSHTNLRIEKDSFYPSLLSDFSFIDKSKVTGLEKIVDMMLTSVKKKDYILLDIIRILTTPNELKKLLPHDFIDEKRFDLYFEILKMFNINFDVCDEFSKISPKIYGNNFNHFLFTMFHQKRNEFKINVFQEYQKKIVDICKQNKIKDDLINDEFCELHEKMNLFCLNQQIKEFTEKYKIESKDKSKLFKILTSLNFKNTRSLHQFVNSLDYSITSTSHEIKYRLELCYGIDYKAKLGFIILNSDNLDTAVFNQILVNVLKVTEFQEEWNINSFGLKEINISLDDFYLSEFIEFLNKIEFIPNCTNEEYYRKCEEKYLSMIYDNSRQNKLHKFVSDNYGNDSAFVLLIHYLAFYEIKTERMQRNNDVFDFDISITQSSYDTQSSEQIDDIFAYPKNQNEKTIFDFIFLFKINEIKEDILSQEMIDQMKKYFPVINFMKSLNVCLFDFDKFLNKLYKEEQLETFMKIINDFDEKSIINNLQLLESISFLSVEFFKSIFENIKNETISNKEILKYISNDNFDEDVHNSINNDDFAVLNNLNSQFIFISYGKINYKENLSLYNIINEIDATNRSKIAVCLTQSLVYLTKLPFKIHTQFFKSIFIDDITRLPMIKTTITNEYDNEKLLIDYSYVIEKLIQSNDNRYLNIIKQIYENDDDKNSYLPIQYIFNFFIGKTFNFTFDNTNQEEYQKFICNIIKNPFYDEIFSHLAQELFGQSYASILDYLFKTKKQNPKLTKGEFVNKMRKITKKCLLCKLIDDHDSLNSILNLFNEYFDEDPYNLIHILNQLLIPSDKYKTKNDVKYNKRTKIYQYKMQNEDSEKIISHIYHMMNKFVSPMIYSNKNYLYFKVSDTKYKKEYFNDYKHLSKYHFYYSLKSALYYLCKYNDKNDLLQEMLTIDHIYINEIGEAVVLPFQVDETSMRNILETVKSDCKIKEKFDISKLRYSITKYIPLKDAHVIKLKCNMKVIELFMNKLVNSFIKDFV